MSSREVRQASGSAAGPIGSADRPPNIKASDLREAFPVTLMEAIEGDDGNVTLVPVMCDGRPAVSQEALRLRDELVTHLACLPAVPGVLDAVRSSGLDRQFGPERMLFNARAAIARYQTMAAATTPPDPRA